MKSSPDQSNHKRQTVLICLGLAVAVLLSYYPVLYCGLVNIDDGDYVRFNPMLKHGLSWTAISWAFTTYYASNWHPLTWISYLVEYQLFGLNITVFHITNVLLHLASSILLFLLLQRMTQARWRSALVTAFFAIHPLHVESVAWISERKDVLSAFFWMLTVWTYVRYVETTRASATSNPKNRHLFYSLSLVFFALGLMSKSMLVTLPFVLLLLDYWPLQRLRPPLVPLIREKIPYFVLTLLSSWICYVAQNRSGAVASMTKVPLGARLANVPVTYVGYIKKTVWPANLTVLYTLQLHMALWIAITAGLFLALVTALVIWRARAQPYLPVGWFWFLGMLVPVIGLVQVGAQSMADRYDYLPGIGLSITLIWAACEWWPRSAASVAFPLAGTAVVACMGATWMQVHYWTNSEALFRHAMEVPSGFGIMASSLGRELLRQGRVEEALPYLRQAVDAAPLLPLTHYDLGHAYFGVGRIADALDQLDTAVRLNPEDADTQLDFGRLLLQNGLAADALPHLQKVLQLNPNNLQASTDLAWILACHPDASLRNGAKAFALASHANEIAGGQNPIILTAQAAADAEIGKFPEAIATIQRASHLVATDTNSPLAASLPAQLALYQSGKPVRTAAPLPLLPTPPSQ